MTHGAGAIGSRLTGLAQGGPNRLRPPRGAVRYRCVARDVEEYVAAYRRVPESSHDQRRARQLARRTLAALPWDEK